MAQKVKISTIGATPLEVSNNQSSKEILDQTLEYLESKIEQVLPDEPDMIVLPELCDTPIGISNDKILEYYTCRKDHLLNFFSKKAKANCCYIIYGAVREISDGTRRNSCIVMDRNGQIAGIYDKNHVVIPETEEFGILCGTDAPIIECDFGRVACVICFDLNFEQLRLRYVKAKPDIIVFPSMFHGGLMQGYWAHSCRSYFVSSISVPELASQIRNPHGTVIASTTNYFDYVTTTINLDYQLVHLDGNIEKLKSLKTEYKKGVNISDPGQIGTVLVTCDLNNITAKKMLNEFKIELLDDYLNRSLEHHKKYNGK